MVKVKRSSCKLQCSISWHCIWETMTDKPYVTVIYQSLIGIHLSALIGKEKLMTLSDLER